MSLSPEAPVPGTAVAGISVPTSSPTSSFAENDELITLVEEADSLRIRLLRWSGATDEKFWRIVHRAYLRYRRRIDHLSEHLPEQQRARSSSAQAAIRTS